MEMIEAVILKFASKPFLVNLLLRTLTALASSWILIKRHFGDLAQHQNIFSALNGCYSKAASRADAGVCTSLFTFLFISHSPYVLIF